MTPEITDADRDAASRRYDDLRAHIRVELSETCTVDHATRATDAVTRVVRPELECVYANYLAANRYARELEAELAETRADRELFRRTLEQNVTAQTWRLP